MQALAVVGGAWHVELDRIQVTAGLFNQSNQSNQNYEDDSTPAGIAVQALYLAFWDALGKLIEWAEENADEEDDQEDEEED